MISHTLMQSQLLIKSQLLLQGVMIYLAEKKVCVTKAMLQ